jgi:hypothetical protein
MSLMSIEDALNWLDRNRKQPKEIEPGCWRWTKPDGTPANRHDELPPAVFDRLARCRGLFMDPPPGRGPGPFPWLFETPVHAQLAAILAILYADLDREFDSTSPTGV